MEIVHFTVDAGLINRLGLELVTKSETAVSELIKNAYDADANTVKLQFTASHVAGGSLIIEDDGEGMDRNKLINGFLRLATTDKIHNAVSAVHQRGKAGRKGIGRFATQRLGSKLTIITQTKDSPTALKLTIDWDSYQTDKNIQDIGNKLEEIPRLDKRQGTTLIIDDLREKWSEADIKRVYRYVTDLIQPNFLKVENSKNIVEYDNQEAFEVSFFVRNNDNEPYTTIVNVQSMLFDKALATFSGYIKENGDGIAIVKSRYFHKESQQVLLEENQEIGNFTLLKNINLSFRCYYYIGNKNSYYGISKLELNAIEDYLKQKGGVKLYRNGFVVAKYGAKDNDWLSIDKNGTKLRLGLPFNNDRLLGFVQLTDADGKVFDESAGREGLLEKEAFEQMQEFIATSLEQCFKNFASWFRTTDEYKAENPDKKQAPTNTAIQKMVADIKEATDILSSPDIGEKEKTDAIIKIKQATSKITIETKAAINELEMLRVLAGTGLIVGEFVHEIKQFVPALRGYLQVLITKDSDNNIKETVQKMQIVLNSFLTYTAYFDTTISQNIVRELKPIDLKDAINSFEQIIKHDIERRKLSFEKAYLQTSIITCPMHVSEWNTILQNLYSNALKAIRKAGVKESKIKIICSKDVDKGMLYLNFYDNGIGIPDNHKQRVFDAFFTTSKPSKEIFSENSGMGLGLYIVKQILKNRNGDIQVGEPIEGYNTCIAIQLPLVTPKQYKQYYAN